VLQRTGDVRRGEGGAVLPGPSPVRAQALGEGFQLLVAAVQLSKLQHLCHGGLGEDLGLAYKACGPVQGPLCHVSLGLLQQGVDRLRTAFLAGNGLGLGAPGDYGLAHRTLHGRKRPAHVHARLQVAQVTVEQGPGLRGDVLQGEPQEGVEAGEVDEVGEVPPGGLPPAPLEYSLRLQQVTVHSLVLALGQLLAGGIQ